MTIPELIRDLSISEAKRFDSANLEPSHLLAVLAYRFMIKYDMIEPAPSLKSPTENLVFMALLLLVTSLTR